MLRPTPYFWLDARPRKNGTYAIRFRQNTNPHTLININEFVTSTKHWDNKRNRSKDKNQQARLDDLLARIELTAKVEIDLGLNPTLRSCYERLHRPVDNTSPTTNRATDWLRWMATRHGRGYLQVVTNLKDRKQHNLQLVDITDEWITTYIDWMVRRGLLQSTIKKRIDAIRRTLVAATKRKQPVATLLDEPSIISTAINRADVGQSKQPLDFIELMKLVELDGLSKRHQTVLDEFLLMAFTSVRISDLMAADRWIINNDSITLRQQKTKGIQSITLNDISRRLIKKYATVDTHGYYSLRLPVFTGQYFNRELKIIGPLAGIKKPISAHVGRHSYARLLSDLGLPEHIRAVELGHAAGSVTQGYGRQTDNNFVRIVVNAAMRKAFAAYKPKQTYEDWYFRINPYMNEIQPEVLTG